MAQANKTYRREERKGNGPVASSASNQRSCGCGCASHIFNLLHDGLLWPKRGANWQYKKWILAVHSIKWKNISRWNSEK